MTALQRRWLAQVAVLLATVVSTSVAQQAGGYLGRVNSTVPVPRVETAVTIDGRLDEDTWARAAVLSGFSQYRPVDGRPADDSTQVLVYYAPDAIYFGIRAYESHGPVVRATLADRDNIGADDRLHLLLDTYNDNRRALLFAVNPLGIQQDGVQSEGFDPSQSAGGRFDGVVDISPDFLFESRGRVTEWGFEVEVRIPFKSLRYQSVDPQTWGLQVVRITQHSGYEDTWTPAVRANASFLIQSGRLTGLTGLRHGLVIDLNPEFTSSLQGAPSPDGWDYGSPDNQLGGNLRWGINPNATLSATINPDFSQVESDVGQVTVNERFDLFIPEKRPFFLEALEQYDTPNRLIYTRKIYDPVGGVKLTAKIGSTAIAYLGAADASQFSRSRRDTPLFNLLRVRRDFGASSTIGVVHTDRIEGEGYNRVTGADARVVWRKIWYSDAQIAGSWTGDGARSQSGTLWNITFADRTGRSYGNHFELGGITSTFDAQSGFVPRRGIVDGRAFNRFSWYGQPGARVEQVTTFIGINPLWRYEDFPRGGASESRISSGTSANLRGGWRVGLDLSNSYQRFEEALYRGSLVDAPTGPTPMASPQSLANLPGASASISSPNRAFSWNFATGYGATAIFAEAAEGRGQFVEGTLNWRPTALVRVEGRVVRQRITRERDGSEFSTATIPRLKLEYQFTRSIFVRYVGQYRSQDRSALRDPRTGNPLLLSPAARDFFGSESASLSNDFRNDFLFSYKPTTGTVFFVGYGASMSEPSAFSFERSTLNRVSDGFFLKASYTYRP